MEKIYREAVARVEARYHYDAHGCLHLTGIYPGTVQGAVKKFTGVAYIVLV